MKEDLTWVARLVRPDLHPPTAAATAPKASTMVAQQPLVAQPDMGARTIVLTVLFFAINLSAPFLLAAVVQRLHP